MHYFAATLYTLGVTTIGKAKSRATELRTEQDRGSVTLEQVLITLGLFLIAGLVVAGITAAINARLNQIK